MEQAISIFIIALAAGVLVISVARWAFRRQAKGHVSGGTFLLLTNPGVRDRLTKFLQMQSIVGSANIRDGKVLPMIAVADLEPLTNILRESYYMMAQPDMRPDLYMMRRDQLSPRLIHDGMDVETLRKAFTLLEQVAEDRRKSRSVFKGMTDDEIDSFVRGGMSAYFKSVRAEVFAADAKAGKMDDSEMAGVAREALKLALLVKGATI